MNTKFQLLVIVIVAVFSLSLNFSVDSKDANKSLSKSERKEYVSKSTEEKLTGLTLLSVTNPDTPKPITQGDNDSTGLYSYDDGSFHFFHFNRIKRLRKRVKNLCFFAKVLLFCTHLCVLTMELMHLLNH